MRKITSLFAIAIATAALCTTALAQPRGGGPHDGTGAPGGPGEMGPGGARGGERLLVASDGSSLVLSRKPASTTTDASMELLAVTAAGAIAWRWTPTGPLESIVLAPGLAVVSVADVPATGSTARPSTGAIVALRLASGAEAWRLSTDGIARGIEVAGQGLLAVVGKESVTTTGSGTSTTTTVTSTRQLTSLDLTGRVLWTLTLDQ